MFYITELLKCMDFSLLIQIKLITSFTYLLANYVTHKIALPVTPANMLRFLISILDFVILLILLWRYIYELGVMAIAYSIVGILFCIALCANSWLVLELQKDVKSVFIISLLSLIIILILYVQFISMGLAYKGPMAALLIFNATYIACWIILDRYPITITNFMERIGEKLSWVDHLIGSIAHNDLALRNVCSLSFNLLNLTYIHTIGEAPTKIVVILISVGLLSNLLIGLRLLKASASVKLHNGFMVQIIEHGYNNIRTIYNQLKTKQLPKACWHAWVITLTMGVTFISPCYAMTSVIHGGEFAIDASLAGEQGEDIGAAAAVAEGTGGSRSAEASRRFGRDVGVSIVAGTAVAGAQQLYTTISGETEAGPSTSPEQPRIDVLEAAIARKDETIVSQAETIAQQIKTIEHLQKRLSWFEWFKGCCKKQ